jgi:hypothetical protein
MPAFDYYNVGELRTTAGACQPPMRIVGLVHTQPRGKLPRNRDETAKSVPTAVAEPANQNTKVFSVNTVKIQGAKR